MRIRLELAIALLALGPSGPTLAAQIPAREVKFLEDPYPPFEALATRIISRAGVIYAVAPYSLDYRTSPPVGVAGFFVDFPEYGIKGYFAPDGYICASSGECVGDTAINQAGRVVGGVSTIVPVGFPPYTWTKPVEFRFDAQTDTYLEFEYLTAPPGYPTAPTSQAFVVAITVNDGDLIAGSAKSSNSAVGLAPIWWPSPTALAQELPRLSGANAGPFPARINTAGTIVGNTGGSAPERAAVWKLSYSGYSLALLGELPGGTSSRAYDIGFFGGIVGRSDDGTGAPVAVVWRSSGPGYSVTPLPVPPGGSCSAATAINTSGDIAGNCTTSTGAERGVVWHKVGGTTYELLHELEPLPGHTRSIAYALDNDGQAGGGSGPLNAERAVLWPVVPAAPVSVPALSHGALVCLAAAMAGAAAATLRAR